MSKKLSNPVYYDEYRYKSYLWREDGRHALPSRKKTGRQRRDVRPDRPCKKDKKSRIDREAFFVTVTILLCFSLTFVLAELSGRGTLMNLIAEKKKRLSRAFYCTDKSHDFMNRQADLPEC